MNIPSPFLINAALRRGAWSRSAPPCGSLLIGAVLTDVPLVMLSLGTYITARMEAGQDTSMVMRAAFDERYFRDPLWIVAHNVFHAPILLVLVLAFLWRYRHHPGSWWRWALWLFAGCAVHSLIDLATHYDDGPPRFFPFAWAIRLHRPISYGDRRHYGSQFVVFEIGLDAALVA